MINRNLTIMTGRATRDAELKQAQSSQVCTIRLACNERVKQKNGEYKEKTVYIDAECWGQRAEFAATHVKKGSIVSVVGKLEQDEWGEGENRRSKHKIYVKWDLQVDNYRPNNQGAGDSAPATAAAGATNEGADLPF